MNGTIFPPIGERERMQFRTVDLDAARRTYSRGCTIEKGNFVMVRVPLDAAGEEKRDKLTEDELRFVEHNITPHEWAAAQRRNG